MATDVSRCLVEGKGVEVAVVGEESTAILKAINSEGKPCKKPINSLLCELTSVEAQSAAMSCKVEKKRHGQYQISYQPTVRGRHQLHIKVEGLHIKGSPFSVAVRQPLKSLGTPVRVMDGLKSPYDVACTKSGEILVSEGSVGCISVFNQSGQKLRSIGKGIFGDGTKHISPTGITLDGEENILAIDRGNSCVVKLKMDGTVVARYSELLIDVSTYIAWNPSNNKIYVSDWSEKRLYVLNPDFSFSHCVTLGSIGGHDDRPSGLAIDSTGKVYVANHNNHCIQVLTPEGVLLKPFGKHGKGDGELDTPEGIAIDSDDNVYVNDMGSDRVCIFTSKGRFVTSFGKRGCRHGEFQSLRGLAVNKNGDVYACDVHNGNVQVF